MNRPADSWTGGTGPSPTRHCALPRAARRQPQSAWDRASRRVFLPLHPTQAQPQWESILQPPPGGGSIGPSGNGLTHWGTYRRGMTPEASSPPSCGAASSERRLMKQERSAEWGETNLMYPGPSSEWRRSAYRNSELQKRVKDSVPGLEIARQQPQRPVSPRLEGNLLDSLERRLLLIQPALRPARPLGPDASLSRL